MRFGEVTDALLDGEVWFVGPNQSAYQAIEKMPAKDVGALLVIPEGDPIGCRALRFVSPQHTLDECMAVMTKTAYATWQSWKADRYEVSSQSVIW